MASSRFIRFGLLAFLPLAATAQDRVGSSEPRKLVETSLTGAPASAGTAFSALSLSGHPTRQRIALTWLIEDAGRDKAKLKHPFRAYLLASAEPRPAALWKQYLATENASPSHVLLRSLLAANKPGLQARLNIAPAQNTKKRLEAIEAIWDDSPAKGRVAAFLAMNDDIPLGAIQAVIRREDPAVAMRMFAAHAESRTVADESRTWTQVEKFAVMVRVANDGPAGGVKIEKARCKALLIAAADSAQRNDLSAAAALVHMHVLVSTTDEKTDVRGPLTRFAQSDGPGFVRRAAWHCLALRATPKEFVEVAREQIRMPTTEPAALRVVDRAHALVESMKKHGEGAAIVADQLRPLLAGKLENSWSELCVRTIIRSLNAELTRLLEKELQALADNDSGVAEAAQSALQKR